MLFDSEQIRALVDCKSACEIEPWASGGSREVDKLIRQCVEKICSSYDLCEKSSFDHYGSGYASFVDCWFYRESGSFRLDSELSDTASFAYTGLVVLFCRLTNYYVMFEESKSWKGTSRSSYLPYFGLVDHFETDVVTTLARTVESFLSKRRWKRAFRDELDVPLPDGLFARTILEDGHHRHYDALFHWVD